MLRLDDERVVFGPYYGRLGPHVEHRELVLSEVLNGEVRGTQGSWGGRPHVKARRGSLPVDEEGFEFWSFAAPDNNYGPYALWYEPGKLVVPRDRPDVVLLRVALARITLSLRFAR